MSINENNMCRNIIYMSKEQDNHVYDKNRSKIEHVFFMSLFIDYHLEYSNGLGIGIGCNRLSKWCG